MTVMLSPEPLVSASVANLYCPAPVSGLTKMAMQEKCTATVYAQPLIRGSVGHQECTVCATGLE